MDEHKKENRRRKRKNIIGLLILLLIILIILFFVRLTFTQEIIDKDTLPVNVTSTYSIPRETREETCVDRIYNWSYKWEGWAEDIKGEISPNYRLYNNEPRAGDFSVRFLFFDSARKAFVSYDGKDFDAVKEELSDTDMISDTFNLTLAANTNRVINIYTKKSKPNANYWVYADLKAPNYKDCKVKITIINETVTKSEQVNKTVSEKRYENVSIRLIDYLIYILKKNKK